jgi:hypothetical protein
MMLLGICISTLLVTANSLRLKLALTRSTLTRC